jgi:hypothetical protein
MTTSVIRCSNPTKYLPLRPLQRIQYWTFYTLLEATLSCLAKLTANLLSLSYGRVSWNTKHHVFSSHYLRSNTITSNVFILVRAFMPNSWSLISGRSYSFNVDVAFWSSWTVIILWALNVVKQNGGEVQPTARFSWDLIQSEREERREECKTRGRR